MPNIFFGCIKRLPVQSKGFPIDFARDWDHFFNYFQKHATAHNFTSIVVES